MGREWRQDKVSRTWIFRLERETRARQLPTRHTSVPWSKASDVL